VIANAEQIKGKAGQSLRDHLDDVRRNRLMNAAVTDLDLPADLLGYTLGRGDAAKLAEVFDDLAFGPTIRRDVPVEFLGEGVADAAGLQTEPSAAMPTVSRPHGAELAELLSGPFADGATLVIDGSWELAEGDTRSLALASDEAIALIDPTALDQQAEDALRTWLADPTIPKSALDTKLAGHELGPRDLTVTGWHTDLGIAEFLCRPDQRPTDLAGLALRHLQEEIAPAPVAGQQQLDLPGTDDEQGEESQDDLQQDSQARTVFAAHRLVPLLRDDLEEHAATTLHDELELPLASVLREMERVGIATEDQVLADLDTEHEAQQTRVAEAAFEAIGGDRINLGSPKQLQEVLYEKLNLPRGRRTKTGYSTNAETLQDLFEKTEHPFLANLLAHRDVTKMRQIIETLRRFIAVDGRIHTTFHQTVAATGRLSSNNPNLQNIPMRTEEGRRIRGAFHASDGFETLLTADYSQIEMRIMAHLSEDAGLIEAFRSGEDLHRFVASRVFDVAPEEVTGAMRSKTKAVSYGLAYGLSSFGLSRQLRISRAEADALRDGYFERFGGVRDYLRSSVEKARETGFTETILGRRRYLPDLTSDNRQHRENAERVALNSPIQGSAADIIKLAMLRVDRALREADVRSRVLLQVHDELVVEIAPGEFDQVREIISEGMDSAYRLEVGIGVGHTWLEAAH
jgi:DNA polymerase-1